MVTYRKKNGELLKEGGSMKTGKRKNQKYISAMLIAAMSVGNVTGVLAEPVNTVAVSKEQGSEVWKQPCQQKIRRFLLSEVKACSWTNRKASPRMLHGVKNF